MISAEYYTKTIISANVIIVETCVGSSRYYETVNRSRDEDLALAQITRKYKALACTILNIDVNASTQAARAAKNAQVGELATLTGG